MKNKTTVEKHYQNGQLVSVGFDSLEEVYAYRNINNGLVAKPSNEYVLDPNCKEMIQNSENFKKFIKKINENEKNIQYTGKEE